jgi:hypothetical protein
MQLDARASNPIGTESRNTVNNALKLMKSSANVVRHPRYTQAVAILQFAMSKAGMALYVSTTRQGGARDEVR